MFSPVCAPLCAALLSRAINEQCVSRRAASGGRGGATHPADDKCYRGGGFLDEHRGFFTPGKKFRQPAYLATSFSVRTNPHTHGTTTAPVPLPII
eukprot:COSAG06_NODE_10567_length_1657_cov_2.103338_2_plen_95_part_00